MTKVAELIRPADFRTCEMEGPCQTPGVPASEPKVPVRIAESEADLAYTLQMKERVSTDGQGVATCLGLQGESEGRVEGNLGANRGEVAAEHPAERSGAAVPVSKSLDIEADED